MVDNELKEMQMTTEKCYNINKRFTKIQRQHIPLVSPKHYNIPLGTTC